MWLLRSWFTNIPRLAAFIRVVCLSVYTWRKMNCKHWRNSAAQIVAYFTKQFVCLIVFSCSYKPNKGKMSNISIILLNVQKFNKSDEWTVVKGRMEWKLRFVRVEFTRKNKLLDVSLVVKVQFRISYYKGSRVDANAVLFLFTTQLKSKFLMIKDACIMNYRIQPEEEEENFDNLLCIIWIRPYVLDRNFNST